MTGKKYLFTTLLFTMAALAPLLSQTCDCANIGNCPQPIFDNSTTTGTFDVTVNGPNDLGQCPLTSVCFSITHTWVGDLMVTLTSPSGQNYMVMADANNNPGGCGTDSDNIDVCIVPGTGNPLTNNTEYICNSGPCPSGTCCLVGNWTMPCGGVTDPITGAQQAPSCDLNDFNIPGNPANGAWTVTVNDICGQDVGTLNNFTLSFACGASCVVCAANGGTITNPDFQGCLGDPGLNLNIIPSYTGGNQSPNPNEYDYAWVIALNGTIQAVNPTPNMTSFPPGNYTVCGFSYIATAAGLLNGLIGQDLATSQAAFNSSAAPFCGDYSDDCMEVTIGPAIPPTFVDTALCLGDCITVGFQPFCASGSITLQSWLGCDSVVNVIITPIQPTFSNQNVTVCSGECIFVNNQQYCPPDPVVFTVPNWQGCDSTVTIVFNEIITLAIINPPQPPPISCNDPVITLDGLSSIPFGSTLQWQGPNNFNSTQPIISVNIPGDYTLTVTNNAHTPPCTAEATVTIGGSVTAPDLQLNSASPVICAGESIDLATLNIVDLNNINPPPVLTYHSATPTTPANELFDTNVTPLVTTTYYVRGTAGTCFDELPITVTVNPVPVADFTATSPICINGASVVSFTGSAPGTATFNWNFGGGTAVPGTGPGPHSVTWGTGGTKTITLVVNANGCESASVTQNVEVSTQLPSPVINCISTSNQITFYWDDVQGASGYNVTVVSGPMGTQIDPTTYVIANLMPNQQVTISVEAISGNACPNSTAQLTCSAQDCPPITVAIAPVADICLTANPATVQLVATQTGGAGGGIFTWSGPGVNPTTGVFNPANANPGPNTVLVSYEEGTCTYNASRIINVWPLPTANFTASTPICGADASTVNYTGNASNSGSFTWDFDGGTANPGTGPGPHSVTWAAAGTYEVSLMVSENGCHSDTMTHIVEVSTPLVAPQVSCVTTTNSVEFIWNNIPGASGFDVNIISGGTGIATSDTSMLFNGLNPGDAVTIQVVALDPGPCPDVSVQQTCIAQDCPSVTIDIVPVPAICLDANALPVNLQASTTGGVGGGSFTWSGTGVSAAGAFDPQQANIGANTITATYQEGDCSYTETIVVTVIAQPVAGFTASSPICISDDAAVSYTGTVLPGMMFNWDFGTGTATPGTGQGPHLVSWSTAGTQPITLTVTTAQGCASEPFSANVAVEQPLVAPIIGCVTNTNSIEFNWPNVVGATSYTATVVAGPQGSQVSQNAYIINGLQPGDQATISLTVSSGGPCPDVTVQQTCTAQDCPPIAINIAPVPDICLNATVVPFDLQATVVGGTGGVLTWAGIGVSLSGTFDPAQVAIGANTVTAIYVEGNCTYTEDIIINVYETPDNGIDIPTDPCVGQNAVVTVLGNALVGAAYDWDFGSATVAPPGTGAGPHTISWGTSGPQTVTLTITSAEGCVSEEFTTTVQVDEPLVAPLINCNTTLNSIQFSWTDVVGATDYDVTLISGTAGSLTSQNTYDVTGLNPNDQVTIELTVSNNSACPPVTVQQTCTAQECLPIVVSVNPVAPICLGSVATVQLAATITGGAGGGTGTWSGPGTNANGVFNPATAGVGTHQVVFVYVENNCTYQIAGSVQVLPTPTANFNATATICVADAATVTYNGTAPANATYTWDFGGGTGNPGTGQGPHQVSFPAPGNYDIALTVTQGGCTSTQVLHSVQVDPELVVPDIDCNTTTQSIEFTWDLVPNATDYEVTVLAGSSGSQTSQTSYAVNGLQPNDQVTIELTVSGNTACPPVSVQQTCVATDCPTVAIDIVPVDPICLVPNTGTVQLAATVTGGTGTAGIWSGPGVNASGVFNPNTAGVGVHTLTFVYEENSSCSYDESIQISIVAPPVADAGPDGEITCDPDQNTFVLGGDGNTVGPNISYNWTMQGGNFPDNPGILHPTVALAGIFTLTVTNDALPNCSDSDIAEVTASQDIPQLSVSIVPVSCFGENDAVLSVTSVDGGQPPYLYSINGGNYSANNTFPSLPAGIYTISVIDASGCEASQTFDISQPQALNVELVAIIEGGGNIIRLGDSTELQALTTLPADSIDNVSWFPPNLVSCDTCLNTFVTLTGQTTLTVTVESNGCVDSDDLTLFVKKERPVYVPNAFSPNSDGTNDVFMIFAGEQVSKINSFLVFDRWGETIFSYYNFLPNDPAYGWDGTHRGEVMNPSVFTWFAEIEFVDGSVELYEGDVTLMK